MAAIVSREFRMKMDGYGLTTAEIHYHLPDHPSLLQVYVWQDYDLAPKFPELRGFLDYWTETLERAALRARSPPPSDPAFRMEGGRWDHIHSLIA